MIFGGGTGRSSVEVEDEPDSPFRGDDASRDTSRAHEPPVSAPPPPPPVRAVEDLESVVHLTPDQALQGTVVELTLDDGTVIELNTPPLLEMAGVCGLKALPPVAVIISCSSGS